MLRVTGPPRSNSQYQSPNTITLVIQIAAAQDVGKALNPKSVEGQIEGGTAQGLGLALMEELQVEEVEELILHQEEVLYKDTQVLDQYQM